MWWQAQFSGMELLVLWVSKLGLVSCQALAWRAVSRGLDLYHVSTRSAGLRSLWAVLQARLKIVGWFCNLVGFQSRVG